MLNLRLGVDHLFSWPLHRFELVEFPSPRRDSWYSTDRLDDSVHQPNVQERPMMEEESWWLQL